MRSDHILSQLGKGDIFACNADTSKVFYYTRKKLLNDGIEGKEIVELYVDYFFWSQGIGAKLIEFAKETHDARFLWVLEKNVDAI